VEIDFQSYFSTIPRDKLMIPHRERVVDGSKSVKQSLKVGVEHQGTVEPTAIGVPQVRPLPHSTVIFT